MALRVTNFAQDGKPLDLTKVVLKDPTVYRILRTAQDRLNPGAKQTNVSGAR